MVNVFVVSVQDQDVVLLFFALFIFVIPPQLFFVLFRLVTQVVGKEEAGMVWRIFVLLSLFPLFHFLAELWGEVAHHGVSLALDAQFHPRRRLFLVLKGHFLEYKGSLIAH